jgi:molecular chaperone DnaK (HSP70)
MLELIRCPNCAANISFASGATLTTCDHCGAQVALGARPTEAAPETGETIFLKITPTMAIPLLQVGSSLPASVRETIGSIADAQTQLHVDLQAGMDSNPAGNRSLLSVVYPLGTKRSRGMPVAQLELSVDRTGTVKLAVREEGTTNTQNYTGFRIAIRAR